MKKTRKFVVDGVEVSVTTSKIVTDSDSKTEELRFLRWVEKQRDFIWLCDSSGLCRVWRIEQRVVLVSFGLLFITFPLEENVSFPVSSCKALLQWCDFYPSFSVVTIKFYQTSGTSGIKISSKRRTKSPTAAQWQTAATARADFPTFWAGDDGKVLEFCTILFIKKFTA